MADEETETPTSGLHLAKILKVDPSEGIVLAVFPEAVDEIVTQEIPYFDVDSNYMHVVMCKAGAWGMKAMDVVTPCDERVKWWRARAMMTAEKMDILPIRYEGPIGEIPQSYFDNDYVFGIRFYDSGPWFWPKEQPKSSDQKAVMDAVEAQAAGNSAGG